MNLFDNYKIIIFDLDDTLYPEIDYLKHAYYNIALHICKAEIKKSLSINNIYDFLLNEYLSNGRNKLFEKLSIKYGLVNYCLHNYLSDLRTVKIEKSSIELFPEIKKLLFKIREHDKIIYILTNGHPLQQMNKIYSLNFPFRDCINIIYASQNGRIYEKPNPYYILEIIRSNNIDLNEMIFIGDSIIDKQTAVLAGIRFLNIAELKNNLIEVK